MENYLSQIFSKDLYVKIKENKLFLKIEKIAKSLCDEFVYNNHLSALVGVFLVLITSTITNTKISFIFLLILYLISYIVYSYNRYKELQIDIISNPQRTAYLKLRLNKTKITNYVYFLLLIIFLFYSFKLQSFLFAFFLLIIGLLYTTHFKKLTRKIIAFKSIYVAGVWISTILFYTIYYSIDWNISFSVISLFLFIRLLVGINFFDIKDIESDKKENLLTLSVLLGRDRIEKFLMQLNLISAIPLLIAIYFNYIPLYSLGLLISIPWTWLCFKKLNNVKTDKDFIYYVMLNGESAVWLLFLFLTKLIFY